MSKTKKLAFYSVIAVLVVFLTVILQNLSEYYRPFRHEDFVRKAESTGALRSAEDQIRDIIGGQTKYDQFISKIRHNEITKSALNKNIQVNKINPGKDEVVVYFVDTQKMLDSWFLPKSHREFAVILHGDSRSIGDKRIVYCSLKALEAAKDAENPAGGMSFIVFHELAHIVFYERVGPELRKFIK